MRDDTTANRRAARQQLRRLLGKDHAGLESGALVIGGETVRYDLRIVDARPPDRRAEDERRGAPAGPVIVVVPGHGQTVEGPRKLIAAAALLSRSGIAWCVDPVPCRGGDCTEGQAIAAVVREKLCVAFPGLGGPAGRPQAVLIGWSHGGGEALRAAAEDPELFPSVIGLCPTGLTERRPVGLLSGFILETLRITGRAIGHGRWTYLFDTLRLGADLARGLVKDLRRGRSLGNLVADVAWAARRVVGPTFPYSGEALIVWGRHDSVIRWRDTFPGCAAPDQIENEVLRFQRANLPCARRVEAAIVDGDHVAPEADALGFVRLGLGWLDQLADA